EFPLLDGGGSIVGRGVDVVVLRTDVDGAVGADRRRRGHCGAGRELPLLCRRGAVVGDGVQAMVVRADVNRAVGADRRRADYELARSRSKLPLLGAAWVNRVQVTVVGTYINRAAST